MEERRRRALRLSEYDYSAAGCYFVTLCTHQRRNLFWVAQNVGALHEAPVVPLSRFGQAVDGFVKELPKRFPNITVEKYVVMPNHVHLLLSLSDDGGRALREAPLRRRPELAKVVGYLKMNASKAIHQMAPNLRVWQTRYYDHVVRDEHDFLRIWRYIDENPARWELDEYNQKETASLNVDGVRK